MAKLIRVKDIEPESYEPPLKSRRGIDSIRSKVVFDTGYKTFEKPRFTMSRTVIPPGGKNQSHYHVKCDAGAHIIKGRVKMFFGPHYDMKEVVAEEGDFIFVPAGEIHGVINLSDTEPVDLVTCYGGVANWEEAETVFVDPPSTK